MASQQAAQKSVDDLVREVLRLEKMKVGIEANLVNAKIALYAAQGKPSPLLPITAAMFSGTQTSLDAHRNSVSRTSFDKDDKIRSTVSDLLISSRQANLGWATVQQNVRTNPANFQVDDANQGL